MPQTDAICVIEQTLSHTIRVKTEYDESPLAPLFLANIYQVLAQQWDSYFLSKSNFISTVEELAKQGYDIIAGV